MYEQLSDISVRFIILFKTDKRFFKSIAVKRLTIPLVMLHKTEHVKVE